MPLISEMLLPVSRRDSKNDKHSLLFPEDSTFNYFVAVSCKIASGVRTPQAPWCRRRGGSA